jgi:hypothetical protein
MGANFMNEAPFLPSHGRIACRKCFTNSSAIEEIGLWQAVNDPSAWGAADPIILVLGFSKGFTQATASLSGDFEAIPFKNMRPRLTAALRRIGLLGAIENVETKFSHNEKDFAFGSLVRCSLSRLDLKSGVRKCTGDIMPKAFSEPVKEIVHRCADTFLRRLPASVRAVVMLGTGDAYISGCAGLIKATYSDTFREMNEVSYRTGDVVWTHVAHPSGLNGHFDSWMEGNPSNSSGRKMLLAREALATLKLSFRQAA